MQLEITDAGEALWLDDLRVFDWQVGGLSMHLFTSAAGLGHDASAIVPVEAAWPGYAPATLSVWSPVSHSPSIHAHSSADPAPEFPNSSGGSVFAQGVYLQQPSTLDILGWGYLLEGGAPLEIPDASTLTILTTLRMQTAVEIQPQ